ncbi:hypothetical protein V5799_028896 [Amblyomma americanum]|uniref:Secreted protein n=1 Tax=Amblyomma americanum TaxID=6943 RepID=A0AAQ4DBJ7_AMBAM
MRFVVFSFALCMLAGLATAINKRPNKLPPWNPLPGFPSPYPAGNPHAERATTAGAKTRKRVLRMVSIYLLSFFFTGRRRSPSPLERSDHSGSFGK